LRKYTNELRPNQTQKKKNKIKIGVKLRKNFDTTKKIYEQKLVTNKFGGAQTKTYYTQ
jgi:hypothetical protein